MKHTVTEHKLASGAKGLLIDVPGARVVEIYVTFNAGFEFGDVKFYETPHVLEHLIGCGSKHYPDPSALKIEVGKNGGYRNAYTTDEVIGYELTCPESDLERVLDLLAEYLTEPLFPRESLATELSNVREELIEQTNDYGRVCSLALNERLYPREFLNLDARLKQLPGITRERVLAHYQRTHTAANARFYLAGAVGGANQAKILARLEKMFARLPRGERLESSRRPALGQEAPIVTQRDVDPLYYYLKICADGVTERQDLVLDLLAAVLLNGWDSLVFGEARRRGLAYDVAGGAGGWEAMSGLKLFGSVTAEHAAPLMELIAASLQLVADGKLTEDRLEAARRRVIGERDISYQTADDLVGYYYDYYLDWDRIRPFEGEIEQLRTVTAEEMAEIARFMLEPKRWGISWLGNLTAAQAAAYTAPLAKLFL